MPTGFTADIKDGITFQTFAMNCARAFGACVMLRDEPGGGEAIPEELKASQYHATRAAVAREELAALDAMSGADKERGAGRDYDNAETLRVESLQINRGQRAAYLAMLAKVDRWTPPTQDHVGLKTFMQEQIRESIKFDCNESYYREPIHRPTGAEWADKRRAQILHDIEYHANGQREEDARTASRNAWLKALRESLRERVAA
jgi:hypothetical protein